MSESGPPTQAGSSPGTGRAQAGDGSPGQEARAQPEEAKQQTSPLQDVGQRGISSHFSLVGPISPLERFSSVQVNLVERTRGHEPVPWPPTLGHAEALRVFLRIGRRQQLQCTS